MHSAISVVHTCGCDLLDAHDERCCITRTRLIRIQRALHSNQRAGLALACFISVTQFNRSSVATFAGRLIVKIVNLYGGFCPLFGYRVATGRAWMTVLLIAPKQSPVRHLAWIQQQRLLLSDGPS